MLIQEAARQFQQNTGLIQCEHAGHGAKMSILTGKNEMKASQNLALPHFPAQKLFHNTQAHRHNE